MTIVNIRPISYDEENANAEMWKMNGKEVRFWLITVPSGRLCAAHLRLLILWSRIIISLQLRSISFGIISRLPLQRSMICAGSWTARFRMWPDMSPLQTISLFESLSPHSDPPALMLPIMAGSAGFERSPFLILQKCQFTDNISCTRCHFNASNGFPS